jgi:hypothetical protein
MDESRLLSNNMMVLFLVELYSAHSATPSDAKILQPLADFITIASRLEELRRKHLYAADRYFPWGAKQMSKLTDCALGVKDAYESGRVRCTDSLLHCFAESSDRTGVTTGYLSMVHMNLQIIPEPVAVPDKLVYPLRPEFVIELHEFGQPYARDLSQSRSDDFKWHPCERNSFIADLHVFLKHARSQYFQDARQPLIRCECRRSHFNWKLSFWECSICQRDIEWSREEPPCTHNHHRCRRCELNILDGGDHRTS